MYVNRDRVSPDHPSDPVAVVGRGADRPGGPVVAIVGGGYSGAAVAWHLARHPQARPPRIVVFEPRAELGRGLAYSTPDPDHRLNVPDRRMTLVTGQPLHFHDWLARPEAPLLPAGSATPQGDIFAPRAAFGQYVAAQLAPCLAQGQVEHRRTLVQRIERQGTRFVIRAADGTVVSADLLVLAVSHPPPGLPSALLPLQGDPALIADPAAPGALAGVAPDQRVLIVGSGLTSADILATLMRQGQRSAVHVLSRHGWRSQPHGPQQPESGADFARDPARSARALLRRVRLALAADAAQGLTWHPLFDRLRAQGAAIWAALPQAERRRFLRHLRALWDIHRFRIAPQTHAVLCRAERARRVIFHAAHLQGVASTGQGLHIAVRPRGGRETATLAVDRVILATGPAHGQVLAGNPALASLQAQGLLRPDPLGLGIETAADGRAVGGAGPVPGLYVAGPLARGTVGELMGVPEVTAWAEHLVRELVEDLALLHQGRD